MSSLIHTLDSLQENKPGITAVYLIRHAGGALLIDCSAGSTLPAVLGEMRALGLEARDVTDVLLTHIHLDHAGAAGWWAQQGARIHVHPVGAPHLRDPEKLIASATRIYGQDMERLWGDFLAVPDAQLIEHHDNDVIQVGEHQFLALDTPGHAEHHYAFLFQDVCFSGDVGGVRIHGFGHVRPPTPPPEVNFEKWRASIERMRGTHSKWIAPTHFGLYENAGAHLDTLERSLDAIETWTAQEMAHAPTPELFRAHYAQLLDALARADGEDANAAARYADAASPSITADGVYRWWKKYRAA